MKTKELIKLLNDSDPTGELECTIKNRENSSSTLDIYSVTVQPGYYDGPHEVLVRDQSRKNYNIIGAKIKSEGKKVVLEPFSIKEAISEDPKLPVEFDRDVSDEHKKLIEQWRKENNA